MKKKGKGDRDKRWEIEMEGRELRKGKLNGI